ncbi:hypothetical protein RYH73_08570 [Olivibacter sp. CPCC 100613]|uniref:hypothetical protein n=1 Tax=Olivibacter sp. CPCC 100613 TaxID=3079931 RepID=UPI002FFA6142
MRCLRCAIVEDEPLAIQMLNGYISKRFDLTLITTIDNVFDFNAIIKEIVLDVIFLDFKTRGFDGDIDKILKKIPSNLAIVNISASPISYFRNTESVESNNRIYELLKPFSFEKFNRCIDSLLGKKTYPTNSFRDTKQN